MELKMIPLNTDVMRKIGMVRREWIKFVLVGQMKEKETTQTDIPMGEAA